MKYNITRDTILIVKKEWRTPYNFFAIGDMSRAEYWSHKVGIDLKSFLDDFNDGILDDWFKIKE